MPEPASEVSKKEVSTQDKKSTRTDYPSSKTPIVSVKKIRPDLRKKELPLVDLKVTNPILYLKTWWRRIIGNEGIEFRIRVRPLTAIAISLIIVTVSFGLGRFVLPFKIPFFQYKVSPTPTPTPDPFRETAFSGTLRFIKANGKYYLITTSSEAITLEVPENVDLDELIGERILATGKYNQETRTLLVEETSDLEILPKQVVPIPTTTPTPSPTPSPVPTQSPTPMPTESPTLTPEPSPSP